MALHQPLRAQPRGPQAHRSAAAPWSRGAKARWSRGSLASPVQAHPAKLSGGGEDRSDVYDALQVSCRRTKYSSAVTSSPTLPHHPPVSVSQILTCHSRTSTDTRCLNTPKLSCRATVGRGDETVWRHAAFFSRLPPDFSPLPSAGGRLFGQSFTVSVRLQNPEYLHCSKKIKGTLK